MISTSMCDVSLGGPCVQGGCGGHCSHSSGSTQLKPLSFSMLEREEPAYVQGMVGLVDVDSPPTSFAHQLHHPFAYPQQTQAFTLPACLAPSSSLSPPLSPLPPALGDREHPWAVMQCGAAWAADPQPCAAVQVVPPAPRKAVSLSRLPAEVVCHLCSFISPKAFRAFVFTSRACAAHARQSLLQHAPLVALSASCFYPTLRAACLLHDEADYLSFAERKWIRGIAARELGELTRVLPAADRENATNVVAEAVRRQWHVMGTHTPPRDDKALMTLRVCLAQMTAAGQAVALCLGNDPHAKNTSLLVSLRSDASKFTMFVRRLAALLRKSISLESDVKAFGLSAVRNLSALGESQDEAKPPISTQFVAAVSCVLEACTPLILLGQCIVSGSDSTPACTARAQSPTTTAIPSPQTPPTSPPAAACSPANADAVMNAMGEMRSALVALLGYLAEVDCRDLSVKARQLCRMIRFRYRVACLNCKKCEVTTREMKVCACCKVGTYCCSMCQRQHWEMHKHICTFLASLKI